MTKVLVFFFCVRQELRFLTRNINVVFTPISGIELLKPLDFPVRRGIKVCFVMSVGDF